MWSGLTLVSGLSNMSDGTILQRLKNMQQDLLSIENQCNREHQVVWPLVPVLHELDNALSEYAAKAYKGIVNVGLEKGIIE